MKMSFALLTASMNLSLSQMRTEPTESRVEVVMREAISKLEEEGSFAYADLGLTDHEIDLIDQLKFDGPDEVSTQYDRFGDVHLLENELPAFLKDIGNDDDAVIKAVTGVISRTVRNVLNASSKNSAWICVRAFTPTHDFDVPRWHIDGSYYGPFRSSKLDQT